MAEEAVTDAVRSAQPAYHHTVTPLPPRKPLVEGDFSRPDGARHPHHPGDYEITDPAEIAEVEALPPPTGPDPHGGTFTCMCSEAAGARPVTPELLRLLDPLSPTGIPARHRARWVAAAPPELREYAAAWADGGEPGPETVPGVPLAVVFAWMGAVREEPRDAARLLAVRAPERILAAARTEDLAWAVRETGRAGLDAAVAFFAGEHFTTRHPKHRRVPETARGLLLGHARRHRPADLPVLERRLLRLPEDRIRRP